MFNMRYLFAVCHVELGDFDRALDELERALDERAGMLVFAKADVRLIPLRDHPRFKSLLERVGVP